MEQQIARGLEVLGLTGQVPEDAAGKLAEYGRLLLEKNQVMNLTAIRDEDGVAKLHMLDCAALLNTPGVEFAGKRLIDVGTGAGFPGLALKILVPSLEVVLLDSLAKRLDWLEETAAALGLKGVTTVHARAEELAHQPDFRDGFDFATARAVAELRALAELCLPYVKEGGTFLAMKSVDSGQELAEAEPIIKKLGGKTLDTWDYMIPGTEITHRVVSVRKLSPTPAGFPRKWGKIRPAVHEKKGRKTQ